MATINTSSTKKKEFITIKSGSGDDTITLSGGNFKVYAGRGNDTITLSDGTNYVYAQNGDNTITSGSGNDRFYAGKGKDEFVFDDATFGNDVIYNSNASDSIVFGDNLNDTEFSFYRFDSDLVITEDIGSQSDTITLSKYFQKKSKLNTVVQDGNTINIDKDVLIYYAGKGNIKGTNFNDAMTGSDKKDTLHGYAGNDFLLGGKSNDKIYSGTGANTIVVNRGDGNDTLYVDKKATSNTLMFDQNSEMSYIKSGNDLVVKATDASEPNLKSAVSESVRVKNFFTSKGKDAMNNELDIQLIGKSSATNVKEILSEADTYLIQTGALKKSNKLYGSTDYNNEITGGNKNDIIYAGGKDNRIYGGKGNDRFYVTSENIDSVTKIFDESGKDVYSVKSFDTSVYIDDQAGKDTLKISDKSDYTMFFDVSVDSTVASYNSLFLVADSNLQYQSYTDYVAGGVEIGNFFDGNKFGAGMIETIAVGGKRADISMSHFDEIRSNVAAWLNLGDNDFSTAMEALQKGTTEQIQELIAIYQGGHVQV